MLSVIGGVLGLVIRIVTAFLELNAEKRKKKQEALNVVKEGITKRDPSVITAGFDAFSRVR